MESNNSHCRHRGQHQLFVDSEYLKCALIKLTLQLHQS